MTQIQRFALCAAILAVDLLVFFFPLTAVFLVYVILVNPPWVRRFLDQLDESDPSHPNR
ncbi:MAG: hypothetical protein ACLFRG_20755 [Desulfococcaceae bacterium]